MTCFRIVACFALLSAASAHAAVCETVLGSPDADPWEVLHEVVAEAPLENLDPGGLRIVHPAGNLDVAWEGREGELWLDTVVSGGAAGEVAMLTLAARRWLRWADERADRSPGSAWTLTWRHHTDAFSRANAVLRELGFQPSKSFSRQVCDALVAANLAVAAAGFVCNPTLPVAPLAGAAFAGVVGGVLALGRSYRFDRTYGPPPD